MCIHIYLNLILSFIYLYTIYIYIKGRGKNKHAIKYNTYIYFSDKHFVYLLEMTRIDHWNFFSSSSSKNYQDATGTGDYQHLAFS